MKHRLGWMIVAIALGASQGAWAQRKRDYPPTIKTQDYTLNVSVITQGVREPWSIAFIGKDRAIITSKRGPVYLWESGKLSDAIKGTPTVNPDGQGGMMDVAIDPEYAQNQWVYLSYSHSPGDQSKGPAMTRIVRGKIKDGAWTDQQVVYEAKPQHYRSGPLHFGCRIAFDKENRLYFTHGERGAGENAQDLSRPNGKIHRINRDGSSPKDNPFVGKPDVYESIFCYGNRNPQGLTIDPATGDIWSTEHGPMGGDELNLIRPGLNYGWNVITYGQNYNSTPVGEGITEKKGMEQPVKQWTPSPALCGLDIVTGEPLAKWKGNLLVGALKFQEVKRVVIKDRKYVSEEVIVKDLGRVRDVVVGPDGAIYVVLNGPDAVIRLSPE